MNRLSCGAVHDAPFDGPCEPSDGRATGLSWVAGSVGRACGDEVADGAAATGPGVAIGPIALAIACVDGSRGGAGNDDSS
jgi:hypothetical protein